MREIEVRDFEFVSGGFDANACASAILGSGGMGAIVGGMIGAGGGPVGVLIGTGVGALGAGAYAAANNPVCAPSYSDPGLSH